MTTAINKRQQARNEKALQELIKSVPGNNTCADCGARNPGWASYNLGIFLCLRCASLHRALGTHISKVKSLSMDKWDSAQVDGMKRIGNVQSNRSFNPRNVRPQIPIDVDEVDSAMERYIRQKYVQRIYMGDMARQNTGSTSSDDHPPPLPPKPTGRFAFGLRKAATSPRNLTPPGSPGLGSFGQDTSHPHVNKPSRIFGSNVASGDGLESKLATLRDMGFPDHKRNSTVLKGLNGNLDRAVEALIRLGEQNTAMSSGGTPTPPAKPDVNGLAFSRTQTAPASTSSNNPFDALDAVASAPLQQPQPAPPQVQQMYGGYPSQTASPTASYNPFMMQQQQMPSTQQSLPQQQQQNYQYQQNPFAQQQGLEQSLQNMQISNQPQTQQPLFPNRTGGYGPTQPPFAQTNPFQQSFTPPPMPQIPEQYSSFTQPQPQYQTMSSPSSPGNPFLRSSRSQMFSPSSSTNSNPFGQQPLQQQPASNPFGMQPQIQTPTAQVGNPWQTQQQSFAPNPYQQLGAQQSSFLQQQLQQPNYQPNAVQQTQQNGAQQHQIAQNSNPFDKNSILSLYNYPQLAPQRNEQQVASAPVPAPGPAAPVSGHMNPFAGSQNAQQGQPLSAAQTPGVRHVSNESVDFAGLTGGRHSPDAFSGLSASFRR